MFILLTEGCFAFSVRGREREREGGKELVRIAKKGEENGMHRNIQGTIHLPCFQLPSLLYRLLTPLPPCYSFLFYAQ